MLKRIFSFFIFIFVSFISFFLTSLSVKSIRELDPILILIKKNKSLYEIDSVDAIVNDMIIIPGISGISVDIDSSYELMKSYGGYNDNLLVFNEVVPTISISDIYDRYVNSGNKDKKEVSFVFKVEDTNYLEEIVLILKEKDVIGTFFIDDNVVYESPDIIRLLYLNNQNIESLGVNGEYNFTNMNKMDYFYKSYISKKLNYCYCDSFNKDILSICSSKKMHTIVPSINTLNYPYSDIRNSLDNGSIIKFNNNPRVIYELKYIINYIRQKDFKIVSLEKMLKE